MSRGSWIAGVALGLALTLSIAGGVQEVAPQDEIPQQPAEEPAEEPAVEPPSGAAEVHPAEPAAESAEPEESDAVQEQAGEEPLVREGPHGILWGDGTAQWLMALAAFASVGVSIWAVALLRGTLKATKDALTKADKATAAANRAADAAVAANEGFAEASKRELRAYLKVDSSNGVVEPDKPAWFEFVIKNYGKTPANNVAASATVVVRTKPWSWENEDIPDPSGLKPELVLHPEDPFNLIGRMRDDAGKPLDLPQHAFDALKDDLACVYVRVLIYYDDVFGDPHETELRFEFSGSECFELNRPRLAWSGNRAT